jgi:hypothetical protein
VARAETPAHEMDHVRLVTVDAMAWRVRAGHVLIGMHALWVVGGCTGVPD